jgi:general secretion pathway protein D
MAGVNYYLDQEGMRIEGVEASDPVTIKLRKPVSLESALNLILQPKRLSYVIQDEVLRITSEQERSGDVYQQTYYVADLVLPIPNFVPSYNMGLAGAIHEAHLSQDAGLIGGRKNPWPCWLGTKPPDPRTSRCWLDGCVGHVTS